MKAKNTRYSALSSILPAFISITGLVAIATASDITWDNSADPGIQGGAGIWSSTDAYWTADGGTTNIVWDNTLNAADTAVFGISGGTVTINGPINLNGIRTSGNVSGYILNGGTLNFGSTLGTIDASLLGTTGASLFTINSPLTGTGGLTIAASGNLSASGGGSGTRLDVLGDNTGLSGGIAVTAGLVRFGSQASAGSTSISLSNGAGLLATTGNLFLNNAISLGTGNATLRSYGSVNLFLSGAISGVGGFNKTDTGALFLSGANTFTGPVNLQAGTLFTTSLNSVTSGSATSALGAPTAVPDGTITLGGSGQPTLGYLGSVETTDRVVNFSTTSGGIVTGHGNLNFTSNMTGAAVAMGLVFNGGGASSMNGITNTTALLNFNKQGLGIWTVNGNITPNGGNIRLQGGILEFSASSSTTGDAIIGTASSGRTNQGVIRFATGSSVKSASANTNGILGGWATFDNATWAKTNGTGLAIDGLATFTDDAWAAGNNTTVTNSGADPASGSTTNSLRFNAAGAKTLTLAGTNTLTSGGLMVTANVGANNTTVSGGTLAGSNTGDLILHQFNTGGNLTISSIIANNTGATGLTKTGAGTAVLSGANTYTGTTRVFEGTLRVTGNSGGKVYEVGSQGRLELGYAVGQVYGYGVTVNGGGTASTNGLALAGGNSYTFQSTLRLAGAPTTVRTYGTGSATLGGYDSNGTHMIVENTASGSVIDSTVNFAGLSYGYVMNIAPGLNTATGDITFLGNLTGGTTYRKLGAGSVRLAGSGTSSNTSSFDVQAGTLILANAANRLGTGSNVILGNGTNSGQLVMEGVNQTLTALTTAGTGTGNRVVGSSATLSTLTINNSGDTTIAAHLGGTDIYQNNIALTKSGIGVLTLSGTNLYSGNTTVNAGTLRLDYSTYDNSKLADAGTLTLGGNLILNGGSHVEIVGNTVITGTVSISRASGAAAIDLGALSRTGSATLNLATADIAKTNTPNDPTGRLPSWITIDGSPAANDGSGNIVVFVPTFADVFRLGGTISNNSAANVRIVDGGSFGTVTPSAPGLTDILSLTQNATGGPATVSLGENDTLRLGEFGTITATPGAGTLTLLGGALTAGGADDTPGTLAVTGEAVVTIGSVIKDNGTGPLSVTKSGPGSLALTATNDHTGGITLNAGQLMIGDPYCFGFGGTFAINGGTFDNVTGDALTISDSIPQIWGGNFTFLGSHDLTFQSGGVNITANREVTVDAATLEIKGTVGGSGGFTKLGAGTLILSGSGNNWTGSTTVSGGLLEVPSRVADGPYVVNQGTTLRLGYVTAGGYASTNLKLNGDGVAATTGLYLKGGASYNASGGIELLTAPTTIRQYGEGLAAIGMFDINGNGLSVSAPASGSVIDGNIQLVSRGYGMSMIVTAGSETATGDLIVNGPLNIANGGLYKRGTGSVRLNGVATTGNLGIQIQGGRVITGVANALGVNAILPISTSAVLDLNGFDQEASSLSGGGSVVNGGATAATLKINQATAGTFSGVLGGATAGENNFAFVKSGTAALTLSGSNTYTGDTTLAQGTLTLGQPFLADTAAVRVTTGATLALSHGQADTVAELWIDGVQQPAGTYTSVNAAFITGSGSLVVTSGSGDPFGTWATSKGLDGSPGKEAGFGDDPDGDGVENGLEWILGGEPLDGKSGGLVTSTATAGGGLTLSFTRNEDSVGQATLTVEYNGTLANPWNSATIGATTSGPDANGVTVTIDTASNPDAVTVNIPAANAVGGSLFGRLKATKP